MRRPTPPPFLSSLFFPIHLYPLMFILSFPGSLVSVIRAIPIFSDCRRFSRLVIFPFMPFILMAAMVSVLFFLILFLFVLLFCVLGSFRFLVVFGPIMMGLVSLGCWWLGMGFFVVVLWVGFFPFLVTATFSASGSLFSAAFFFTLFVLISVGGSLGWYSFFCGWSEGYPFLFSTATVCFVLFVSLRFFSRSLLLSQFLPRWSGPCVCSALGWVLGLFSSCFTTHASRYLAARTGQPMPSTMLLFKLQ